MNEYNIKIPKALDCHRNTEVLFTFFLNALILHFCFSFCSVKKVWEVLKKKKLKQAVKKNGLTVPGETVNK